MSIMAQRTEEQEAKSNTRLYLEAVIKIVKGEPYSDKEHELIILGRFFNNTQTAARTKGLGPAFFKNYAEALGEKEARTFLEEFNEACQRYSDDLQADKKDAEFEFKPGGRYRTIEALEGLKAATEQGYGGFFLPYYGMGRTRINTHLCTG